MTISTSKTPPPSIVLKDILQKDFSGEYSYKLFGLGAEKSILVGRSAFVGVQISIKGNEITIEGAPPTIVGGLAAFFFSAIGMGYFTEAIKKLEEEVASFLAKKFN